MKKFLYTVILMSIGVIGFMYFSKPVKALNDDVDYRILEVGATISINNKRYYEIVNFNNYGLSSIQDWVDYMEMKEYVELDIQAPDVSSFYFYNDGNLDKLADDVFKMKFIYDYDEGLVILELYALNQVMIYSTDLYLFDYSITYMDWMYSPFTKILTDGSVFRSFSEGFTEGYYEGLDEGYEAGYEDAFYEYGYETEYGAWLSAETWGNHRFTEGYNEGLIDSFDEGYEEGRADYGEYFPPGSPDGMDGWYGFHDGFDYGVDVGFDDGKEQGITIGRAESNQNLKSILDFLPGVLGSIFMFFYQIAQISILGIRILDVLALIFGVSLLILLIKMFL